MNKLMGTTAIALVVVSSLAFAQGSSGTGTSGPVPSSGTSAPSTVPSTSIPAMGQPAAPSGAGMSQGATTSGSGTLATGAVGSSIYLSEQTTKHWLASHYLGKAVYGPNNERVGDVNDILIDKSGTTTAIVVGVGGFLGMGEKNVAVPFNAIQMNQRDGRDELHMNATRSDLEKAPAFKTSKNKS